MVASVRADHGYLRAPENQTSRFRALARLQYVKMMQPFSRAVEEHGPTVLRVCRAVLGAGPDADDAWSETFLAALKAWSTLDEETNIQAWLVRVAQRKAIDITRSAARQAIPVDELPEALVETARDAHDHELWARVAALPEQQRLAIAYHYLGGLTHVETAELLAKTPEAVRRAAADGMKTLRKNHEQ